jgi:hypothetical protein
MPKNDTPVVPTAPQPPKISLTEFCQRLSETVSRPELIGGFEFVERRAGRLKDTEAEFRARFDAFINTSV